MKTRAVHKRRMPSQNLGTDPIMFAKEMGQADNM